MVKPVYAIVVIHALLPHTIAAIRLWLDSTCYVVTNVSLTDAERRGAGAQLVRMGPIPSQDDSFMILKRADVVALERADPVLV